MDLVLGYSMASKTEFKVHRGFLRCLECCNSVLVLDYNYTPWPRREGNLLWG